MKDKPWHPLHFKKLRKQASELWSNVEAQALEDKPLTAKHFEEFLEMKAYSFGCKGFAKIKAKLERHELGVTVVMYNGDRVIGQMHPDLFKSQFGEESYNQILKEFK